MEDEEDDICGLCGEAGADKIPHPVYWPTEQKPGSDLVHASCEAAECQRAFLEYRDRVGQKGIAEFLRRL